MIGTNTGQTAMVIPVTQRKGGQGAKRKRIGKQGGGGGNRGGSTAPRRPMAIPKRTQQRSASRNGDDLPNSTAAMGSRPTNETVTATVTNTNSTGKATVNSSGIYMDSLFDSFLWSCCTSIFEFDFIFRY